MQKPGWCAYRHFRENLRLGGGHLICSFIFIWVNLVSVCIVARYKIMFLVERQFWDPLFSNVCFVWIVVFINCVKRSLIYAHEFLKSDFILVSIWRVLWNGGFISTVFCFIFYGQRNWIAGYRTEQNFNSFYFLLWDLCKVYSRKWQI